MKFYCKEHKLVCLLFSFQSVRLFVLDSMIFRRFVGLNRTFPPWSRQAADVQEQLILLLSRSVSLQELFLESCGLKPSVSAQTEMNKTCLHEGCLFKLVCSGFLFLICSHVQRLHHKNGRCSTRESLVHPAVHWPVRECDWRQRCVSFMLHSSVCEVWSVSCPVCPVSSETRQDKTPPNEASWHHTRTDVVSCQFWILGRIVNHSMLVNGQNPSDFGEEL